MYLAGVVVVVGADDGAELVDVCEKEMTEA